MQKIPKTYIKNGQKIKKDNYNIENFDGNGVYLTIKKGKTIYCIHKITEYMLDVNLPSVIGQALVQDLDESLRLIYEDFIYAIRMKNVYLYSVRIIYGYE